MEKLDRLDRLDRSYISISHGELSRDTCLVSLPCLKFALYLQPGNPGNEITLNISKAKEKLKMFKKEEKEE